MRVPLRWLKDYVEITQSPEELAHTLTMAGLEVEAIERIGSEWGDNIITAQIIHLEKVPGSDHLSYTRVVTGKEELGVVCGAPNIKQGDKVPLAQIGAKVGEMTIGEKRTLGYLSQGMLCSPRELGLGADHSGIYILDPETPVGLTLADILGEVVLDFAIKAHRGDLSSIIGIAREVAALTGQQLRIPEAIIHEKSEPAQNMVRVSVEDPTLCPRYTARVISDITIGPSPSWMGRRLLAAGMRPINNIVDITNYVMLEFGQPLHGFDYDLVRQRHIIVRRAREGEEMTTLDDVRRKLTHEMLLITDPEGPTAIGGVMGGAISEVNNQTTRVLLEAANFKAGNVRRTSVTLGLRSDASSRFEKGLDPEQVVVASNRAAQLMEELCGASVHPGIVDVYPNPVQPRVISFSVSEVEWLTGMKVTRDEVIDALEALNFKVKTEGAATRYEDGRLQESPLQVTVPTYRGDIEEGADLVEEVLRMVGYDRLPSTIPIGPLPEPQQNPWFDREYGVRDILIGAGLNEIVTYAMTSRARMVNLLAHPDATSAQALLRAPNGASNREIRQEATAVASQGGTSTAVVAFDPRNLPAVTLTNPMSSDMESMRLTLMSGLLETAQENSKRSKAGLRFFEVGRRYLPAAEAGQQPDERRSVGIVMCGPTEISWVAELARPADFYDLKGVVETLLDRLHIKGYRFTPTQHPTFHPGRCAMLELPRVSDEGEETLSPIGVLGEVHPLVQQRYDLPHRTYLCELDLAQLYAAVPQRLTYAPISRHQELTRDLALVVDQDVSAQALKDAVSRQGGELLRSVSLFDVYTGDPIPAGKRSLTYTLVYQSQERTLTDVEANAVQERIIAALHTELGAVLR